MESCGAPCLFHSLIMMLLVHRSYKCLPNFIHMYRWEHIHGDIDRNVTRFSVGESVFNVP